MRNKEQVGLVAPKREIPTYVLGKRGFFVGGWAASGENDEALVCSAISRSIDQPLFQVLPYLAQLCRSPVRRIFCYNYVE